jgi:hypothetical protein
MATMARRTATLAAASDHPVRLDILAPAGEGLPDQGGESRRASGSSRTAESCRAVGISPTAESLGAMASSREPASLLRPASACTAGITTRRHATVGIVSIRIRASASSALRTWATHRFRAPPWRPVHPTKINQFVTIGGYQPPVKPTATSSRSHCMTHPDRSILFASLACAFEAAAAHCDESVAKRRLIIQVRCLP